jgi:prevent-host-death family protein
MKRIAAATFKEQCLAILDRLGPEGIVVTKHGRPVARVLPMQESSAVLIGALKEQVKIKGDLLSTLGASETRAAGPPGTRPR